MESLYRKYRPQTFDDVVGQRHVVETLERAVVEGRTSHAYLFCGPRGTGKTTMARLLAKALLCERGPGHLPDGTCEECQLIAAGEHPDVYELDAASRTGVDNVREEIINRVSYAPTRGRYKIYIIDEVHMLTTAAFNALLKTLEEPPSHIVFVLCTTDPQKIPATILSRVQRFDFHAISNDDIQGRLVHVCEQEGFTYDEAALELVVRHARGGMRDALSTLEQLSVFGDGTISLEAAQDLLGVVPGTSLRSVTQALAERDVATLFSEVGRLVDDGRDLLQFTRELAARMRDVYVVSAVGAGQGVVDASEEELRELERESASFGSTDRVARVLSILGDASTQMRTATNQRLVLEIALTRMARPESDLTLEALAERVDALERQVALLSRPAALAAPPAEPAKATGTEARPAATAGRQPQREATTEAASPELAPQPAPQAAPRKRAAATRTQAPAAPRRDRAAEAKPQAPAAPGRQVDAGQLQRSWKQVIDLLMGASASRGALLRSSTIESDDGTTLHVSLPRGSSFALRMLDRQDVRGLVDTYVQQVFGRRQVSFSEAGGAGTRASGGSSAGSARRSGGTSGATRAASQGNQGRRAPSRTPAAPAGERPAPAQPRSASQPQVPQAQPKPAYAMPWDEPRQTAQPAAQPQDDVVPYDDASAAYYGEDEAMDLPAPPARPTTGKRPAPAPAAHVPPARPKASLETGAAPRQVPPARQQPPALQEPSTASAPAASAPAAQAPAPKPQVDASTETVTQVPVRKVPDDIPPDLTAIVESAFEVFGDGVKVSTFRSEPDEAYEDADDGADDGYDSTQDLDRLDEDEDEDDDS